jgi:uncharacterized membrane protein YhaH (DUF805 family)
MKERISEETSYILSHVVILKFFVVWSILEAVLYFITNGDKKKELILHIVIFIVISLLVYFFPSLSEHVKT